MKKLIAIFSSIIVGVLCIKPILLHTVISPVTQQEEHNDQDAKKGNEAEGNGDLDSNNPITTNNDATIVLDNNTLNTDVPQQENVIGKGLPPEITIDNQTRLENNDMFLPSTTYEYVSDYNMLLKANYQITAYPDSYAIKNCEKDYTGIYGYSWTEFPNPYAGHKGTDYGTRIGTPLYGIDGFYVGNINHMGSGFGNHIAIENGRVAFVVAHLDSINVSKGQRVDANTIIGYTGNTGNSTGPHLHVQMWNIDVNDWVDSTPYLAGRWRIPSFNVPEYIDEGKVRFYLDNNWQIKYAEERNGNTVEKHYTFYGNTTFDDNKWLHLKETSYLKNNKFITKKDIFENNTQVHLSREVYYDNVQLGTEDTRKKECYTLNKSGNVLFKITYQDVTQKELAKTIYKNGTKLATLKDSDIENEIIYYETHDIES